MRMSYAVSSCRAWMLMCGLCAAALAFDGEYRPYPRLHSQTGQLDEDQTMSDKRGISAVAPLLSNHRLVFVKKRPSASASFLAGKRPFASASFLKSGRKRQALHGPPSSGDMIFSNPAHYPSFESDEDFSASGASSSSAKELSKFGQSWGFVPFRLGAKRQSHPAVALSNVRKQGYHMRMPAKMERFHFGR